MAKGFITKFLKKPNGDQIFFRLWEGRAEMPVLILLHGIGSHSLRYEPLALYFQKLGYTLYAFDFSGFGKNQTFKGHIPNFNVYVNETLAMVKLAQIQFPKNKIFILAESMGGIVAIHFARYYQEYIHGLILLSPWIKSKIHTPLQKKINTIFNLLFNKYTPYPVPFTNEILTRDYKMQKNMEKDELNVKTLTAEFLSARDIALYKIKKMSHKIELPLFLLQAGNDLLLDTTASYEFFNAIKSQIKEFILLEKFYHALSIDREKEFVFELIASWIKKIISIKDHVQVH